MRVFVTSLIGAVCTAFYCLSAQAQSQIDLQGHRGARWLLPENTLAGFKKALRLGVTTLELDVVATRDDVLVISHDPLLNPDITRERGRFLSSTGSQINHLSLRELVRYDVGRINPASAYAATFHQQRPVDGQKIPRLKDLFNLVKASGHTRVKFAIETKITPTHPEYTPSPQRMVELLLREIRDAGVGDRVQIQSFDWRTLQLVQQLRPGTPTVYLTMQQPGFNNVSDPGGQDSPWTAGFQIKQHDSVPKMIKAAGGTHWSSYWSDLNEQSVREAQRLGIKVIAWTVNEREAMNQMLDLGVDGLVTDRPDLAIKLLRKRRIKW